MRLGEPVMTQTHAPTTCFVLPDGSGLGGVTNWSVRMAATLGRAGHPCTVLEHVNPTVPWREDPPPQVEWPRFEARHPGSARRQDVPVYLPHYLRTLPATLVPNYTEGAYAACAEASRQRPGDMRVLAFAHADQPYYYELLQRYEAIATLLVAVSEEIGARLRQLLPHRAADVRVRPYGVEASRTLARAWSAASQPLRLAYAGRLVETQKRVGDLAALANVLADRGVDFTLDIVGAGVDEGRLRDAVARSPEAVQRRVRFLGRVAPAAMPALWQDVDVAVLVSEYEGISIAMLEAMAGGCVPVVTRVSGTRDAILEGRTGCTVPVGDMVAMADAITGLASDRDRLATMGRQAHARVLDRFTVDDYTQWFLALVDEAWSLPPRAWPDDRPSLIEPPPEPATAAATPYVRYSLRRFLGKLRRRAFGWIS